MAQASGPDAAASPVGDGRDGRDLRDWRDEELASQWASGDRLEGLLTLPRRMTADLFAHAEEPVRTVLDVGSGPGGFLETVLARLPGARGIWTDVSEAMRGIATARLASYGDRVEFRLLEAADLSAAAPSGSLDAVLTSRMTHHLGSEELAAFYAAAASLLGAGGWIANLDHVEVGEPWGSRLAAARADVVPPNPSAHHHDRPHPSLDDHLEAVRRLGEFDVAVPWRAYATVLVLARRG
jgi:SAM-dependent methyltransferase